MSPERRKNTTVPFIPHPSSLILSAVMGADGTTCRVPWLAGKLGYQELVLRLERHKPGYQRSSLSTSSLFELQLFMNFSLLLAVAYF